MAFVAALAGCGGRQEAASPGEQVSVPAVRTVVVTAEEYETDEFSAPGTVEINANRIARVVLPVAGRIASVSVKTGDAVSEGQTLMTVESPELDAIEYAFRQAKSVRAQAAAAEQKAQADLDRLHELYAHQAIAHKEVLAAQSAWTLAATSMASAEAALQEARRRHELYGLTPGEFGQQVAVRAPLAGKVLAVSGVAGEYRSDLAAPLITVADLRVLWVSSNVPENRIRHVRVGGEVEIELVAFPGETLRGRVWQIADTVEPETRTVKVRAQLDNPAGRFRAEMFGRMRFHRMKEQLVAVPQSAMLEAEGKAALYVEERPGRLVRRFVTVARQVDERVLLRSGVKAGERVVTAGVAALAGGS